MKPQPPLSLAQFCTAVVDNIEALTRVQVALLHFLERMAAQEQVRHENITGLAEQLLARIQRKQEAGNDD
jgi:hypothetical protein